MKSLEIVKLYTINGGALALSYSNIEVGLKIILLIVTIGYTVSKWIGMYSKSKKQSS